MYRSLNNNNMNNKTTYYTLFDPYVYETLNSVKGANLRIDTTIGAVEGVLADVKKDHIVLTMPDETPKFIRTQQIVAITPL